MIGIMKFRNHHRDLRLWGSATTWQDAMIRGDEGHGQVEEGRGRCCPFLLPCVRRSVYMDPCVRRSLYMDPCVRTSVYVDLCVRRSLYMDLCVWGRLPVWIRE